jgi:3-(3-hydroxy-phenyl)propionate hydroxylase
VPTRVFALLHAARPVLLDLRGGRGSAAAPWADRVCMVHATSDGPWDLPALGTVSPPTGVLVRPDGHVAWVGEGSEAGLTDALTRWFGPPGGFHTPS